MQKAIWVLFFAAFAYDYLTSKYQQPNSSEPSSGSNDETKRQQISDKQEKADYKKPKLEKKERKQKTNKKNEKLNVHIQYW
jgi:hypothetical protein